MAKVHTKGTRVDKLMSDAQAVIGRDIKCIVDHATLDGKPTMTMVLYEPVPHSFDRTLLHELRVAIFKDDKIMCSHIVGSHYGNESDD